jgi:hypothetical protein
MLQDTRAPIRVGVFDTVGEAANVVRDLKAAGFSAEEISIVSSDEEKAERFGRLHKEDPAGSHTDAAVTAAGIGGVGLGAAALLTGLLTTGGAAIIVAGAFVGVAAVGTFAAAMVTRGAEGTLADYYDQAVTAGKILVAVETDDVARQQLADGILLSHNAEQPAGLPREP